MRGKKVVKDRWERKGRMGAWEWRRKWRERVEWDENGKREREGKEEGEG